MAVDPGLAVTIGGVLTRDSKVDETIVEKLIIITRLVVRGIGRKKRKGVEDDQRQVCRPRACRGGPNKPRQNTTTRLEGSGGSNATTTLPPMRAADPINYLPPFAMRSRQGRGRNPGVPEADQALFASAKHKKARPTDLESGVFL